MCSLICLEVDSLPATPSCIFELRFERYMGSPRDKIARKIFSFFLIVFLRVLGGEWFLLDSPSAASDC